MGTPTSWAYPAIAPTTSRSRSRLCGSLRGPTRIWFNRATGRAPIAATSLSTPPTPVEAPRRESTLDA